MAASYKIVTWTPFKKRFDLWLLVGIAVYLVTFILITSLSQPVDETFTPIQMLMRAFGTLAFLLLSFILCIGPLARLTPRFKPFLYNRRHLGVTTFFVALFHAALSTLWYHGFSDVNPFLSIFVSNPRYDSIAGFPFESLGFVALFILFLMAATSHDFWNANLGPRLWKTLHMLVYLAYGLLVAHIALGAIQFEKDPIYVALLGGSAAIVAALHLLTALKPSGHITQAPATDWIEVGPAGDMVDAKARIIRPRSGEAIAVFRDGQTVAAVSHVCRHQGGPLGEGLVIDGCVTCPWHGFQYRLADGTSPPPFTEKVATYPTRIENGIVYVRAIPDPPGTPQTPSIIRAARV